MILQTLLLSMCLLWLCHSGPVQIAGDCKAKIAYEDHNQIDPPPLLVGPLSGRAVLDVTGSSEAAPVPGLCIGLFTEREHRLIATTVTDQEGRFRIPGPATGRYRLVGMAQHLCTVNARLRVVHALKGRAASRRRIVLHMVLPAIDRCSYADFK